MSPSLPPLAGVVRDGVEQLLERLLGACPRLVLELPGPPVSKERARTFVEATGLPPQMRALLPKGHPAREAPASAMRTRSAKKTGAYEAHVREVARLSAAAQRWPLGGYPGARYVVFADLALRSDAQDASNVLKALEDALNGVAWADDRYVCQPWPTKRVCGPGELPGARVTIWALGPTEKGHIDV
ncbi:MAG TPA: RusA family crossover junction endodeoxyribonuclease [Polyangiaceae bacterium]|nr:RusA family crossover junction endodeoxyribonuclease [Polyangiaceae bacterium]